MVGDTQRDLIEQVRATREVARRELQQDQQHAGDDSSGSGDEGRTRWMNRQQGSPPAPNQVVQATIATENQMGQIVRLRRMTGSTREE
jgi:hypothetical protein